MCINIIPVWKSCYCLCPILVQRKALGHSCRSLGAVCFSFLTLIPICILFIYCLSLPSDYKAQQGQSSRVHNLFATPSKVASTRILLHNTCWMFFLKFSLWWWLQSLNHFWLCMNLNHSEEDNRACNAVEYAETFCVMTQSHSFDHTLYWRPWWNGLV